MTLPESSDYHDAIAVCTNPHGMHEHVPAEDIRHGRCFADCDCTPRRYIAVDALSDYLVGRYDYSESIRLAPLIALIERMGLGDVA